MAQKLAACCPEPHIRSSVVPHTSRGKPAIRAALRAMLNPCSPTWSTQPTTTSSTSFGSTLVRATTSLSARASRSSGRTPDSLPFFLPTAVRTAPTITAVFMSISFTWGGHPGLSPRPPPPEFPGSSVLTTRSQPRPFAARPSRPLASSFTPTERRFILARGGGEVEALVVAGGHGADPRSLAHPVGQLPGLGPHHRDPEMGQDREPGADGRDEPLTVLQTEMALASAGVENHVQEQDVALVGRLQLGEVSRAGDHGHGEARPHEPETVGLRRVLEAEGRLDPDGADLMAAPLGQDAGGGGVIAHVAEDHRIVLIGLSWRKNQAAALGPSLGHGLDHRVDVAAVVEVLVGQDDSVERRRVEAERPGVAVDEGAGPRVHVDAGAAQHGPEPAGGAELFGDGHAPARGAEEDQLVGQRARLIWSASLQKPQRVPVVTWPERTPSLGAAAARRSKAGRPFSRKPKRKLCLAPGETSSSRFRISLCMSDVAPLANGHSSTM